MWWCYLSLAAEFIIGTQVQSQNAQIVDLSYLRYLRP